tara:strand:- start:127 stop:474 length:348 start_codon:yes stop_codon:yes gene_type:complete
MNNKEKRNRELTAVSDLLDGVVGDLLRRTGVAAHHVLWAKWREIVGEDWQSATPIRLDGTRLIVVAPDSVSATKLRYSTAELLERIADHIGPNKVTTIMVRVKRLKEPQGLERLQ